MKVYIVLSKYRPHHLSPYYISDWEIVKVFLTRGGAENRLKKYDNEYYDYKIEETEVNW